MKGAATKQQHMEEFAHATARILIASYFVAESIGLIIDPNSMGQFLSKSQIPGYLLWPNAGFELIASLAILVGFQTRTAAALLALYLFWTGFILNYKPGDPVAIGAFWRDLAMIGGLLMLCSHGRGRYAIDNFLQRFSSANKPLEDAEEPGDVVIQSAANSGTSNN